MFLHEAIAERVKWWLLSQSTQMGKIIGQLSTSSSIPSYSSPLVELPIYIIFFLKKLNREALRCIGYVDSVPPRSEKKNPMGEFCVDAAPPLHLQVVPLLARLGQLTRETSWQRTPLFLAQIDPHSVYVIGMNGRRTSTNSPPTWIGRKM